MNLKNWGASAPDPSPPPHSQQRKWWRLQGAKILFLRAEFKAVTATSTELASTPTELTATKHSFISFSIHSSENDETFCGNDVTNGIL